MKLLNCVELDDGEEFGVQQGFLFKTFKLLFSHNQAL